MMREVSGNLKQWWTEYIAANYPYYLKPGPQVYPVTITNQREACFFRNHDNRFDGWFIDVYYVDQFRQTFFIVQLDEAYEKFRGQDWPYDFQLVNELKR